MNSPSKKRAKAVSRAVANERLEGLVVSKESRKIADNYVTGKITAKEAARKIRLRYDQSR